MSRRKGADEDEWWVESKGYERERTRSQTVREAKAKLAKVLEHYGLDEELKGDDSWQKVHCPFHDDRHPSAVTNGRYFQCFACEVKGDAIDLVMQEESMSFSGALAMIARL